MKRRLTLFGILAFIIPFQPAVAQQKTFAVDQQRSLVWWQLDPHFGHLWATTCPSDPSWQPGEGHSGRFGTNFKKRPKIKVTNQSATDFPLFPRDTVRANCRRAVKGSFTTANAATFAGLKGAIAVQIDSITNGSDSRDLFAKKYIYTSSKYPMVKFTVDSLTSIRVMGDTVNAIAVGTFELRGVQKPTRVQVQGINEPAGLRVRGLFAMPAKELQDRYSISRAVLSMGVGAKLWDTLFMGFDVILNQSGQASSSF
jgi:hypothetical protein